jgi:hypothetical protein
VTDPLAGRRIQSGVGRDRRVVHVEVAALVSALDEHGVDGEVRLEVNRAVRIEGDVNLKRGVWILICASRGRLIDLELKVIVAELTA